MGQEEKLSVVVTYGQLRAEFSGTPEAVMLSLNNFLMKNVPELDLAKAISVSYSTADLINMFGEFVKITPEGARVWVGEHKLSDKDIVALQLVAAKLGYGTGRLSSPSLSIGEIQALTGLKAKSISSRLSEITKMGFVEKEVDEHGVRYKITTQGIHWLKNNLSKKLGK